jgi:small subunit ribosomal protein S17
MPKRVLIGKVVSAAPNKTVIVEVTRKFRHPKYHKVVQSRKKFAAHDENNKFKVGDMISIVESKPVSKTKTWLAIEIEN